LHQLLEIFDRADTGIGIGHEIADKLLVDIPGRHHLQLISHHHVGLGGGHRAKPGQLGPSGGQGGDGGRVVLHMNILGGDTGGGLDMPGDQ